MYALQGSEIEEMVVVAVWCIKRPPCASAPRYTVRPAEAECVSCRRQDMLEEQLYRTREELCRALGIADEE